MSKKTFVILGIVVVMAIVLIVSKFFLFNTQKNIEDMGYLNVGTSTIVDTDNKGINEPTKDTDDTNKIQIDTDTIQPSEMSPEILLIPDETIVGEPDVDEPVDYEKPPVAIIYNKEADLNSDGHIDISEWETWIQDHPEDLDQDMFIGDEEKQVYEETKDNENDDRRNDFIPMTSEEIDEYQAEHAEEIEEENKQAMEAAGHGNAILDEKTPMEEWAENQGLEGPSSEAGHFDENGDFVAHRKMPNIILN